MSDAPDYVFGGMLKLLATGCHRGCEYDEAEGELINHCKTCCQEITRGAYELFVTQRIDLSTLIKEAARWQYVTNHSVEAAKILSYSKREVHAQKIDKQIARLASTSRESLFSGRPMPAPAPFIESTISEPIPTISTTPPSGGISTSTPSDHRYQLTFGDPGTGSKVVVGVRDADGLSEAIMAAKRQLIRRGLWKQQYECIEAKIRNPK